MNRQTLFLYTWDSTREAIATGKNWCSLFAIARHKDFRNQIANVQLKILAETLSWKGGAL